METLVIPLCPAIMGANFHVLSFCPRAICTPRLHFHTSVHGLLFALQLSKCSFLTACIYADSLEVVGAFPCLNSGNHKRLCAV